MGSASQSRAARWKDFDRPLRLGRGSSRPSHLISQTAKHERGAGLVEECCHSTNYQEAGPDAGTRAKRVQLLLKLR